MPKYIDAEKFVKHISGNLSWNGEQYNAASVISDLKIFPAADVEPVRHGRWINHTEPDQNNNIMCWCSECGAGDQHGVGVEVPYCWKCGAKMQDSTRGKLVGEALDRIISEYTQSKEADHENHT